MNLAKTYIISEICCIKKQRVLQNSPGMVHRIIHCGTQCDVCCLLFRAAHTLHTELTLLCTVVKDNFVLVSPFVVFESWYIININWNSYVNFTLTARLVLILSYIDSILYAALVIYPTESVYGVINTKQRYSSWFMVSMISNIELL